MHVRRLAAASVAGALTLVGCSNSSSKTTPAATPTTATTATTAVTVTPTSAASTKVSANTASAEQITSAFEAAGVPNASRWTREVVEYRPYPADDPTLTKLRQNLAKYNPSPDTLNRIFSVLQP